MYNKKIGITILIITLVLGIIIFNIMNRLNATSEELGCFPNKDCIAIERSLSMSHIVVGILSFALALGFYLIFFSKTEQAILEILERNERIKSKDEKFNILLKGLDEFEKKIINVVRNEPGITQNTLTLRVNLSKAKVSQVLSELEKKNLVKRIPKKKTLSIYLRENI